MMKRAIPVLIGVLALLLTASPALACPVCGPPDKVTISGPGLDTVALTDQINVFGVDTFFGSFSRESVPAPKVSAGYLITRYYKSHGELPEEYWTSGFDRLHYYPNPDGGRGAIYYDGPNGADQLQMAGALELDKRVGKWYVATAQEDLIMEGLFNKLSLTPPAGAPSQAVAQLPNTGDDSTSAAWLAVLAVGLLLAGALLLRRLSSKLQM